MGQYFDAFIPGMYQDENIAALNAFCDRIGARIRAYDDASNVFSLSLKNTIYSLDGCHYWEDETQESPIASFIREFRATPLKSYTTIEIFVRPEGEEYWHAFAHDGVDRKCCHINTAAAESALAEIQNIRGESNRLQSEIARLRANFQAEVNKAFLEKLSLWNHMPVEASK